MPYRSLTQQSLHYFSRPHSEVCRAPLDVAAAWTRESVGDNWRELLSEAETEEVRAALTIAETSGRSLAELTANEFPLPTLATRIAGWRETLGPGRGFVVIGGLPTAEWTPDQAEIVFWCLGQHLGLPGAQNPQGDLLGHVRADPGAGSDPRYYRTRNNIACHCDAADVVGLLCLKRAREGGLSRIVSSVSVYNAFVAEAPELVDALYEPYHLDTHGEGQVLAIPVRPCRHYRGTLRTTWHSDYYRSAAEHEAFALDDRRRAALEKYDEITARPSLYLDMDLQPGDIQWLSNHTQLHARTSYVDHEDPAEARHLLRLWLSLPGASGWRERFSAFRGRMELVNALLKERRRARSLAAAGRP